MDTTLLIWPVMAALVALVVASIVVLRRATRRFEQAAQHALTLAAPPSWLYLVPGRAPAGPVDLTALRAMLADGRLAGDALAAPIGSNDWRPLTTLIAEVGRGRGGR